MPRNKKINLWIATLVQHDIFFNTNNKTLIHYLIGLEPTIIFLLFINLILSSGQENIKHPGVQGDIL